MELPKRLQKTKFVSESAQISMSEKWVDAVCEPHWHEFYELELFVEGRGVYELNGKAVPFDGGSVFLMTPVDIHAIRPFGRARMINIMFSEKWLDESLVFSIFSAPSMTAARFTGQRRESFVALCRAILAEGESDEPFHARMLQNLLECAVVAVLRGDSSADESRPGGPGSMQRALLYLQNHFREPITLRESAEQAGLSPAYFSEKFHAYAGESYQSCLVRLRCEYAQRLLAYTDAPVTEICYESGFLTLSHFQRTFKGRYGLSPREWRRRMGRPSESRRVPAGNETSGG